MNMELFDDYFKRDYCNYIERFLCLKMKELVLLRQEIIDNSFMQEIEKEISLDCKLRSNRMPVPLLRNGYSIFNGTKYR